jgi:hypothetical protein
LKEFSVEVPRKTREKLQTVGDVIKYIEEKASVLTPHDPVSVVRADQRRKHGWPCFLFRVAERLAAQTERMNFALLRHSFTWRAQSFLGQLIRDLA